MADEPHDLATHPARLPLTNPRREAYAQNRGLFQMTRHDAWVAAGYRDTHTARKNAYKTEKLNPALRSRIEYHQLVQARNASRNQFLTQREILSSLQDNADEAARKGQYAASNQALKMLGSEMHGMFREKVEIHDHGRSLDDLSVAGLLDEISRIAAELGIEVDIRELFGLVASSTGTDGDTEHPEGCTGTFLRPVA